MNVNGSKWNHSLKVVAQIIFQFIILRCKVDELPHPLNIRVRFELMWLCQVRKKRNKGQVGFYMMTVHIFVRQKINDRDRRAWCCCIAVETLWSVHEINELISIVSETVECTDETKAWNAVNQQFLSYRLSWYLTLQLGKWNWKILLLLLFIILLHQLRVSEPFHKSPSVRSTTLRFFNDLTRSSRQRLAFRIA